jgi:tetratricopeptide (TPR) repeat protein
VERYSLDDVCRILGADRRQARRLIATTLTSPAAASEGLGFRDLVLLKAAYALMRSGLTTARIRRALEGLRSRIPAHVPLAGLRIEALGNSVVVHEGTARWAADSGQYLLALQVDSKGGEVRFLERRAPARDAERHFERGLELHQHDPAAACVEYEATLAIDPAHAGARVNLGAALHERGLLAEAEQAYQSALVHCPDDATLHSNLGVLIEDTGRAADAAAAYRRAIELAPGFADAHYNLARLCEGAGRTQDALRHYSEYRRLTR